MNFVKVFDDYPTKGVVLVSGTSIRAQAAWGEFHQQVRDAGRLPGRLYWPTNPRGAVLHDRRILSVTLELQMFADWTRAHCHPTEFVLVCADSSDSLTFRERLDALRVDYPLYVDLSESHVHRVHLLEER